MSEPTLLISIVIPTWNCATVLRSALLSISRQTFDGIEVIISDGASTDDTLEIARSFNGLFANYVIDSRPDDGVYDAINRGVNRSTGRWILILGADDKLHSPDTILKIVPMLEEKGNSRTFEIVYGDVLMMLANAGVDAGMRYAGVVNFGRLMKTNICQQAVFFKRSLFDSLGGFSLDFPVYADWDFHIRACVRNPFVYADLVITDYAANGLSTRHIDYKFLNAKRSILRRILIQNPRIQRFRQAKWVLWSDTKYLIKRMQTRDLIVTGYIWLTMLLVRARR